MGALNGKNFMGFVSSLIGQLADQNMNNKTIILDNCRIPKGKILIGFLETNGHCLPFLNPAEEAFSKWENCIVQPDYICW